MATSNASKEFPLKVYYERTDEPLGGGTYGTVYRYELKDDIKDDELLPFAVAVKEVVHKVEGSSTKYIEREHGTMKEVSHPNIVHYFGKFVTEKTTRFVMELCTTDLESLKQSRKFSDMEVAAILWQILEALHHLHRQQIMHRDVKPSNILLKIDQEDCDSKTASLCHLTVKLCDFGLARFFSANVKSTVAKTTAGTIKYAAPEIRANLEKQCTSGAKNMGSGNNSSTCGYTEKCDVFSAGVLAHELATGKYQQDINCYTDFAQLESSLGTDCDQNLLSLLKCMLHPDKEKRSSVGNLLNHTFIKQGQNFLQYEQKLAELNKKVFTLEKSESDLTKNLDDVLLKLDAMTRERDALQEEMRANRVLIQQRLWGYQQESVNYKLWEASSKGDLKSVKEALGEGAEINSYGIYRIRRKSSLWSASARVFLLDSFNVDLRCKVNALHLAAVNGQLSVAEYLLKEGANVDAWTYFRNGEKMFFTALMLASFRGHTDVVRLLIHDSVDVSISGANGSTALHLAANLAHLSICKLLVEQRNTDINAKDKSGRTPLARAEENKNLSQEYLEDLGYSLDREGKILLSALIERVKQSRDEFESEKEAVIEYLKENGAVS